MTFGILLDVVGNLECEVLVSSHVGGITALCDRAILVGRPVRINPVLHVRHRSLLRTQGTTLHVRAIVLLVSLACKKNMLVPFTGLGHVQFAHTVVAGQVSLNLSANTDTVSDLDRLNVFANLDSLEAVR